VRERERAAEDDSTHPVSFASIFQLQHPFIILSTDTAMERFFTPIRRLQILRGNDIADGFQPIRRLQILRGNDIADGPLEYAEVQLRSTVTLEDFLVYRWDWEDLCAFVSGDGDELPKILWITEYAYLELGDVCDHDYGYDFPLSARFTATSGREQMLTLHQKVGETPVSTEECSVFWRAITTSNCVKLNLQNHEGHLPSGPVLSQFLQRRSLQVLDFRDAHFKEEHCYALATVQRTDLELTLTGCMLEPRDAQKTFLEWFQHNQIVTKLDKCDMESSFLSALINRNTSVKSLCVATETCEFGEEEGMGFLREFGEEDMRSLAQVLPGNLGIEDLSFTTYREETCSLLLLLFTSMSMQPRIKCLSIIVNNPFVSFSAESKATVMKALLQMLHLNTVVQTINLPDTFAGEAVYQNSILPRLEMNRSCFEVQRQIVKRADPSIRPQLLGRVLHMVRYNPNLVFLFLSENVPAFVVTEEQEDASAAPLDHDPIIVSGQKRKAQS
jgi:hypothetical protein